MNIGLRIYKHTSKILFLEYNAIIALAKFYLRRGVF